MNISALTVTGARDFSPQKHETTVWRGHEYSIGCSVKMELSAVVHDDDVDQVVSVIIRTARTGTAGDGHVRVMSVDHPVGSTWKGGRDCSYLRAQGRLQCAGFLARPVRR